MTSRWIIAGLFFAASAQAAIVEIKFDERGRFQHAADIAPGKFLEVCGKIPGGQRIGWSFETTAAVDFNIHYHVGDKVEYPEKIPAIAKREGSLNAPSTQDYCWMWKSAVQAPVQLRLELRRETPAR